MSSGINTYLFPSKSFCNHTHLTLLQKICTHLLIHDFCSNSYYMKVYDVDGMVSVIQLFMVHDYWQILDIGNMIQITNFKLLQ